MGGVWGGGGGGGRGGEGRGREGGGGEGGYTVAQMSPPVNLSTQKCSSVLSACETHEEASVSCLYTMHVQKALVSLPALLVQMHLCESKRACMHTCASVKSPWYLFRDHAGIAYRCFCYRRGTSTAQQFDLSIIKLMTIMTTDHVPHASLVLADISGLLQSGIVIL